MVSEALIGKGMSNFKDMSKALPVGYCAGVDPTLLCMPEKVKCPPCPPQKSKHLSMFQEWQKRLSDKLTDSFKDCVSFDDFQKLCLEVQSANQSKANSLKQQEKLEKQKPVNQGELNTAKQGVLEADAQLLRKMKEAEIISPILLKSEKIQALASDTYDDTDLVTFTVMMEATPKVLAEWCDQNADQAKQLLEFLNDTDLMRDFLRCGGARKGEYPRAVEIYHQIKPDPSNSVLKRLALAISLELCHPYPLFGYPNKSINPLLRYLHYEQAFLLGELDPNFSRFSTWEMRHIVNSDATEDELTWGRQCLMNYRPDIVLSDNPQWNYCLIVKSDVTYTDPDWYKEPKSYDQILSGGGKCGPRAWFGRFVCKAFGIPTWGVKQPGHAAMTRWTKDGWCTNLGAGFQYSDWEGECGSHFQLTTQAIRGLESEDAFMKNVKRLEWIGSLLKENSKPIYGNCLPSPQSPWYSLSLFQRKTFAIKASSAKPFMFENASTPFNIHNKVREERNPCPSAQFVEKDGTIIIPSRACSHPLKASKQIFFMKSFLGGEQLFIKEDGMVEYVLNVSHFNASSLSKYNLILKVCTAHRNGDKLKVEICVNSMPYSSISVELPYSMGMWTETSPVSIDLGGSTMKSIKIRLIREKKAFGFAFKSMHLIPV